MLALRQVLLTYKGQQLGVLEVESKWAPNKVKEVVNCYKTSKLEHPGACCWLCKWVRAS